MKTEPIIALVIAGSFAVVSAGPAVAQPDPHAVKVSVGYADNLHVSPGFVPTPWQGSPGVMFIGTSSPWDAGAILLANPSANPLTVDDVRVDFGPPFGAVDVWGPYPITIPGKGTAILTQTADFNFDGSDLNTGTCAAPSTFKPVVHVTVGSKHQLTKEFIDADQVLNTGGVDSNACTGKSEGLPFEAIHEGQGG